MDANYVTDKACALIKRLHGTTIGAKEFSGGFQSERVDAILYNSGASFLIETKISRSDFLADAKKPFRVDPSKGVGTYRYYACPEGLISVDELPEKWGLIYVPTGRRRASMPHGYGGVISLGQERCPERGFNITKYEEFGASRRQPEGWDREVDGDWWKHPDYPSNRFAFTERCMERELRYMYAIATRYKNNKFMGNML